MNNMNIRCCVLGACLVLTGPLSASPQIEQWHTENGVRTLFVAAPELPMLDIAVIFDAGSGRDGKLAGLAQLTHSLLSTGSRGLNADAVAEKFEDIGARYSASVDLDRSSVTLRSLTEKKLLQQALSTFITTLAKPTFPDKDFQRLKKQALVAIKDSEQRPGDIASRAFYKAMYGDHPYSQPVSGYRDSIEKITLKDVKEFHRRYLVSENALIAMVGDINIKKAREIARQISSSLASGKKPMPLVTPSPQLPAKDVYIPYPSQQAHVYIGQLGIQRGDEDYFILYTGNHVLGGGGFTSRLLKEIRVERGLAYSAYSYFFPLRVNGPFILGLQTRADQAQQAADISLQVIEKFVTAGPTEEELQLAKNNIIGGFPLRVDNNRDILGYLSLIGYYKLPLDYLDTFTGHISAVTRKDVQAAYQKRLQLHDMIKIIVGGPEKE